MALLPTMRSERFSVALKIKDESHKIFQIVFHTGKENTSYNLVTFPYFSESKGLLSKLTFPANQMSSPSISLLPKGKVTSHLVKYTHPLDGNTHFSGDGKIITSIRNQSKRLDASIGHMFTIQMQGWDNFKLRPSKRAGNKVVDLDFEILDPVPEAYKFIGWWFKHTDLKGRVNGEVPPKAQFAFREPDGTFKERGFVISPPLTSPLSDFVMLLSCQAIPKLDKERESIFTFLGGFDQVNDIRKDLHFLGCIYPATDYESLLPQLGSVDFNPQNPLSKT